MCIRDRSSGLKASSSIKGNLTQECNTPFNHFWNTIIDLDLDDPTINWPSLVLTLVGDAQLAYSKCSARAAEVQSGFTSNPNATAACSEAIELAFATAWDSVYQTFTLSATNTAEFIARLVGSGVFLVEGCKGDRYNWEEVATKVLQRYPVDADCISFLAEIARNAQGIADNVSNPQLVLQYATEIFKSFLEYKETDICNFPPLQLPENFLSIDLYAYIRKQR
eukprot:TRINITY_DN4586_c0_g1_i3.p1 TRINITY_DN4586_c0_g1~~TRINITY_DN4586_c0_g1_i3.p1  ORF type:complete len:251 (+),score=68.10 TRINITY_DN4586_c0_g1_i3:85-753(+)